MPFFIVLLLLLWFMFGEPSTNAANLLYPTEPAPWEPVTGFYYPNRNDLSLFQGSTELASLAECRNWVYSQAAINGDPALSKGDYECAVGQKKDFYGMGVYRLTLR
jgi:hypothetical protein